MKFRIISVRGNSVRVKSGITTFDVLVEEDKGTQKIRVPKGIFIQDHQDFLALSAEVKNMYNTNFEGVTNYEYNEFKTQI